MSMLGFEPRQLGSRTPCLAAAPPPEHLQQNCTEPGRDGRVTDIDWVPVQSPCLSLMSEGGQQPGILAWSWEVKKILIFQKEFKMLAGDVGREKQGLKEGFLPDLAGSERIHQDVLWVPLSKENQKPTMHSPPPWLPWPPSLLSQCGRQNLLFLQVEVGFFPSSAQISKAPILLGPALTLQTCMFSRPSPLCSPSPAPLTLISSFFLQHPRHAHS